jgi:SAM-dependent methyltransferase
LSLAFLRGSSEIFHESIRLIMIERQPISWESAVQEFRSDPLNALSVKQNYFDVGVAQAAARYAKSSEYRAISRILGRGAGRALDVGAGRAVTAYALARSGWHVTAIDPDASGDVGVGAVRQLIGVPPGALTAVRADGEHLPFADRSADLVFGRQVLHHLVDLEAGLAEVARVLLPAGRALFVREHVVDDDKQLEAFLADHPLHQMYGGEYAYSLARYESAFGAAGLTVTRVYGPLDSMVNFYPGTRARRVAKVALKRTSREPGRLYSFLAERR